MRRSSGASSRWPGAWRASRDRRMGSAPSSTRGGILGPHVRNGAIAMGSFSIWHWLIVLVIVLLIFGTKKLRNLGSDLGGAVKGFKDGLHEGTKADAAVPP